MSIHPSPARPSHSVPAIPSAPDYPQAKGDDPAVRRDPIPDVEVAIDTIEDALEVVDMANLYCPWIPAGNGDAFAHWLFLNRLQANPADLDEDIAEYIAAWYDQRSCGGDLDADSYRSVRDEQRFLENTQQCWVEMATLIAHARSSRSGRLALHAFSSLARSCGGCTGDRPQSVESLKILCRLLESLRLACQQMSAYALFCADKVFDECQMANLDAFTRLEHILRATKANTLDSPPTVISLAIGVCRDSRALSVANAELTAAIGHRTVRVALASNEDVSDAPPVKRRRMSV
jgi:hypothetical protein